MEKIPFDLEKWNTRKYIVEKRNGVRPIAIYHIKEATLPILFVGPDGSTCPYRLDGRYSVMCDSEHDLFLIPRTKKVKVYLNFHKNGSPLGHDVAFAFLDEFDANKDLSFSGGIRYVTEIEVPE